MEMRHFFFDEHPVVGPRHFYFDKYHTFHDWGLVLTDKSTLQLTEEAKLFLADKGYDIQYGARPLKRALQNYVEDEISELLLDGRLEQGNTISAEVDKDLNKLILNIK